MNGSSGKNASLALAANHSGFVPEDGDGESVTTAMALDTKVEIIINCIIMAIGIPANLIVLVSLKRVCKQTPSTFAIIAKHLCIASLYIACVSLPINTIWQITEQWYAGIVGCKLLMMLRVSGFYMTAFLIIFMSINRYVVVNSTQAVYGRYRRATYMYAIWLLSLLAGLPQLFAFRLYHFDDGYVQCLLSLRDEADPVFGTYFNNRAYSIAHFIVCYAIPVITICGAQVALLRTFDKHKINLVRIDGCSYQGCELTNNDGYQPPGSSVVNANANGNCTGDSVIVRVCGQPRHGLQVLTRARDLTLKTSAATLATYLACWSPHYLVVFISWFMPWLKEEIPPLMRVVFNSCAMINCCTNPIVYGFMVPSVRRASAKTIRDILNEVRSLVVALACFFRGFSKVRYT